MTMRLCIVSYFIKLPVNNLQRTVKLGDHLKKSSQCETRILGLSKCATPATPVKLIRLLQTDSTRVDREGSSPIKSLTPANTRHGVRRGEAFLPAE